jgi:hypothetical protein
MWYLMCRWRCHSVLQRGTWSQLESNCSETLFSSFQSAFYWLYVIVLNLLATISVLMLSVLGAPGSKQCETSMLGARHSCERTFPPCLKQKTRLQEFFFLIHLPCGLSAWLRCLCCSVLAVRVEN